MRRRLGCPASSAAGCAAAVSLNEGLSISEIARRTGHCRGTVRKYLSSQVPPASKKRSKKPSKLNGYREYIISRLQE
jgi:transposase